MNRFCLLSSHIGELEGDTPPDPSGNCRLERQYLTTVVEKKDMAVTDSKADVRVFERQKWSSLAKAHNRAGDVLKVVFNQYLLFPIEQGFDSSGSAAFHRILFGRSPGYL